MVEGELAPLELPAEEFAARHARLWKQMEDRKLDCLLAYGDEKHYENITYLTGFDPRFESAVVVIRPDTPPVVITGLESAIVFEYTGRCGRVVGYGPFSLQGIREPDPPRLPDVLRAASVRVGDRVGLCGERFFTSHSFQEPYAQHFVPHFIWAAVVEVVGDDNHVVNVTDVLTHPASGLRSQKSEWEIALLELANVHAAAGVKEMLNVIQPGMTEQELLAEGLRAGGVGTFAFQPTVVSGERVRSSLLSASSKTLVRGEAVSLHFGPSVGGYCGNVSRSGLLATSADSIDSPQVLDLYGALTRAYRALVETLKVGATGGAVRKGIVEATSGFGYEADYNAGHMTGLSEWEDTIIQAGSKATFASGNVIQADLQLRKPSSSLLPPARIQDAYALADEELRAKIKHVAPDAWARIAARRQRMIDLKMTLDDDLLPLSDLAPLVWPFLLEQSLVLPGKSTQPQSRRGRSRE